MEFRYTSWQAPPDEGDALLAADHSSLPGVVDLTTRLPNLDTTQQPGQGNGYAGDLDVFERYYAEHPDGAGLGVFEE